MRKDIGEHVEGERHVASEHARVIGGHFDAGRRIQVAAHRLDLFGDLPGRALLGPLERHVLEKMRNPVLVRALVAAAATDPNAERRGLEMRHVVGDHDEAGGKTGHLDGHAAAPSPSRTARLCARI
jgi:hypothetical protein